MGQGGQVRRHYGRMIRGSLGDIPYLREPPEWMSGLGHLLPSQRPAADGRSAFESGKSSPPGGIWQLAAQLLGCRPDQYLRQGKLPPAHQPFHQRAEFPLRKLQGLGDGPRDRPAPEVDMSGAAAVDRPRIPTGRDFRVAVVPPTSPANIAPKPMD